MEGKRPDLHLKDLVEPVFHLFLASCPSILKCHSIQRQGGRLEHPEAMRREGCVEKDACVFKLV